MTIWNVIAVFCCIGSLLLSPQEKDELPFTSIRNVILIILIFLNLQGGLI